MYNNFYLCIVWMFMYIYIYVYVYMHINIYACSHLCTYLWNIQMYVYKYACMHLCKHMYIYLYLNICFFVYIYIHTCNKHICNIHALCMFIWLILLLMPQNWAIVNNICWYLPHHLFLLRVRITEQTNSAQPHHVVIP